MGFRNHQQPRWIAMGLWIICRWGTELGVGWILMSNSFRALWIQTIICLETFNMETCSETFNLANLWRLSYGLKTLKPWIWICSITSGWWINTFRIEMGTSWPFSWLMIRWYTAKTHRWLWRSLISTADEQIELPNLPNNSSKSHHVSFWFTELGKGLCLVASLPVSSQDPCGWILLRVYSRIPSRYGEFHSFWNPSSK